MPNTYLLDESKIAGPVQAQSALRPGTRLLMPEEIAGPAVSDFAPPQMDTAQFQSPLLAQAAAPAMPAAAAPPPPDSGEWQPPPVPRTGIDFWEGEATRGWNVRAAQEKRGQQAVTVGGYQVEEEDSQRKAAQGYEAAVEQLKAELAKPQPDRARVDDLQRLTANYAIRASGRGTGYGSLFRSGSGVTGRVRPDGPLGRMFVRVNGRMIDNMEDATPEEIAAIQKDMERTHALAESGRRLTNANLAANLEVLKYSANARGWFDKLRTPIESRLDVLKKRKAQLESPDVQSRMSETIRGQLTSEAMDLQVEYTSVIKGMSDEERNLNDALETAIRMAKERKATPPSGTPSGGFGEDRLKKYEQR